MDTEDSLRASLATTKAVLQNCEELRDDARSGWGKAITQVYELEAERDALRKTADALRKRLEEAEAERDALRRTVASYDAALRAIPDGNDSDDREAVVTHPRVLLANAFVMARNGASQDEVRKSLAPLTPLPGREYVREVVRLADWTTTPGPRHRAEGEHSAEEWRDEVVVPALYRVIETERGLLLVDLDDVEGFAASFVDEVFRTGISTSRIRIKCQDEPDVEEMGGRA